VTHDFFNPERRHHHAVETVNVIICFVVLLFKLVKLPISVANIHISSDTPNNLKVFFMKKYKINVKTASSLPTANQWLPHLYPIHEAPAVLPFHFFFFDSPPLIPENVSIPATMEMATKEITTWKWQQRKCPLHSL